MEDYETVIFYIILFILFLVFLYFLFNSNFKNLDFSLLENNKDPYDLDFDLEKYQNNDINKEQIEKINKSINKNRNKKQKFNPNRNFKSIPERLTCKVFEEYLGREVLVNHRPNDLKNPETGSNMEWDLYDEESGIIIEYNGEQHYVYPCGYNQTEEQFYNQVYRDELKKQLTAKKNLTLIIIPFTVDTCKINENTKKGYTKIKKPTEEYREMKIKEYLYPILDRHFKKLKGCECV